MLPAWDTIASTLRCALWADVQAALWSVLLLTAAAAASRVLRGRLPVWRKGVWLGVMLAPVPLVLIAGLLPRDHSYLVPIDWFKAPRPPQGGPNPATPSAQAAATIYAAWVALSLLTELVSTLRIHQLIGRSQGVQNRRVVQLYTLLAQRMGCSRAPRLVSSAEVASPFIFGSLLSGPTIVLPEALVLAAGSGRSLRAVLAHELAHARAADPFIQRLLGLLRCFLPLTWLCALGASRRFWEDAAEQTGDLRAVHAASLSDSQYAAVLKDLAFGHDGPGAAMAFAGRTEPLAPQTQRFAAAMVSRLRALRLATFWSESAAHAASVVQAVLLGSLLFGLAGRSHLRSLLNDPRTVAAAPVPPRATVPAVREEPGPGKPVQKNPAQLQSAVELKIPTLREELSRKEDKLHRKDERPPRKHKLLEPGPRPNNN